MRVLSIDVGIKNLALCLFEKNENTDFFKILKWDVINVAEQELHKCCFIEKNKLCDKPAKFIKNNQCFCLKHSKKQNYVIPNMELHMSFINKQKISKLQELVDKYSIQVDKSNKKQVLIDSLNEFIIDKCFDEIGKTDASKVDLVNIGKNMATKFNEVFSDTNKIDYVIIENQISPIANRMKTIQGMIVQYFIMSHMDISNIEFISASNKLKCCENTEKIKYSDRKKMGVAKCLEFVSNDCRFSEHKDYFMKHKKKDDLADSFLQGIWFIGSKNL